MVRRKIGSPFEKLHYFHQLLLKIKLMKSKLGKTKFPAYKKSFIRHFVTTNFLKKRKASLIRY